MSAPAARGATRTLADHAYNAIHCPDQPHREAAVVEMLGYCGRIGRNARRLLGYDDTPPEAPEQVPGQMAIAVPRGLGPIGGDE